MGMGIEVTSYLHFGENCFKLIFQLIVVSLLMRLEIFTELNLFFFFLPPKSVSFYLTCSYEIVVAAWKSCFF